MQYIKLVVLAIFFMSTGCANIMGTSSSPEPAPAPVQSSFFYDFNDIRVPEEMEIQKDKSSISPVEGGKAGVMKFRGRAEPISLFDFFYNTMPKDGWTLQTYQKYQRFLLVFNKDNRVCVITVEEDPIYYTWLEIWVSPRVQTSSSPAYSTGAQPLDSYPSSGSSFESERTLTQ